VNLAQLRNHALRQIGVIGVGAAASAEDAEFAETVLTHAHGALEQLGVALWTIDDVPAYAVESFVRFATPMLAPRFGIDVDMALNRIALAELRELTADGRSSTGTADYF
jgi:hypothetical protein